MSARLAGANLLPAYAAALLRRLGPARRLLLPCLLLRLHSARACPRFRCMWVCCALYASCCVLRNACFFQSGHDKRCNDGQVDMLVDWSCTARLPRHNSDLSQQLRIWLMWCLQPSNCSCAMPPVCCKEEVIAALSVLADPDSFHEC